MQLGRAEMPNKTIYVADADLPIFERAQELAGENLSATIVHALRRLVAVEEAMARGLGEVILKVGNHGTYVNKAFMGRELARRRARDEPTHEIVSQVVYQTAKGRLVLYTRTFPAWFAWMSFWEDEDATPSRGSGRHDVDVDLNVDVDVSPGDDDPAGRRSRQQEHVERQQRRRQERRRQQEWWQQKGWSRDWSTWRADVAGNAYRMDIFETLEELKPHVAEELYNAVAQALRGEDVEFLDI